MKRTRSAVVALAAAALVAFGFTEPAHAVHGSEPGRATDYTVLWVILGILVAATAIGALVTVVTGPRRRREATRKPRPIERPEHRADISGG
jgi:hypothetical protein